ncbi:MAG: hypothetical protein HYZ14_03500 [Bacteroidetes bacterium]|nr:hypothetical protein [Bacteroidota bacterium]
MGYLFISILGLVFVLLAFLFPFHREDNFTRLSTDQLKSLYKRWEQFAAFFFIALILMLAWLVGHVLEWVYVFTTLVPEDALFIIQCADFFWYVNGAILAFAITPYVLEFSFKKIVGPQRYGEYLYYTNEKHGFDGRRLARPLTLICGIFSLGWLVLAMDNKVFIYEDRIVIDDLFGFFEKEYTYEQVKSVRLSHEKTPSGSVERYVISFADNETWDTGKWYELDDSSAITFITKKAVK